MDEFINTLDAKKKEREEIERKTKDFLERGGVIQHIPYDHGNPLLNQYIDPKRYICKKLRGEGKSITQISRALQVTGKTVRMWLDKMNIK